MTTIHQKDPGRVDQPNRWWGLDTCECACGCLFLALDGMCLSCDLKAREAWHDTALDRGNERHGRFAFADCPSDVCRGEVPVPR